MAFLGKTVPPAGRGSSLHSDVRGVVYVEFLIAFIPIFIFFLALCQLVLTTTAHVVVAHAANAAVRSAIVVLEDPVDDYGDAPRGNLTQGGRSNWGWDLPISHSNFGCFAGPGGLGQYLPSGARLSAIRMAAILPLFVLAPKEKLLSSNSDTLERGLITSTAAQIGFAYCYTNAATSVSLVRDEKSEDLATQPIDPHGSVTVSVTYLYHCSIPIARTFMCQSLSSIVETLKSKSNGEQTGKQYGYLSDYQLTLDSEKYVMLKARATLINQGADYVPVEQKP